MYVGMYKSTPPTTSPRLKKNIQSLNHETNLTNYVGLLYAHVRAYVCVVMFWGKSCLFSLLSSALSLSVSVLCLASSPSVPMYVCMSLHFHPHAYLSLSALHMQRKRHMPTRYTINPEQNNNSPPTLLYPRGPSSPMRRSGKKPNIHRPSPFS